MGISAPGGQGTGKQMGIGKSLGTEWSERRARRWRRLWQSAIQAFVIICLMPLIVSGCLVAGSYPRDWPNPGEDELVGKCPSIAGTFRNVGTSYPKDAGSPLLTGLLDLPDGEQVEITQSPESIRVVVWTDGTPSEVVEFVSVWTDPLADRIKPRSFQCPIDVGGPGRRQLQFSHLVSTSLGIGLYSVSFRKDADGALIVTAASLVDRAYYRFESVNH